MEIYKSLSNNSKHKLINSDNNVQAAKNKV